MVDLDARRRRAQQGPQATDIVSSYTRKLRPRVEDDRTRLWQRWNFYHHDVTNHPDPDSIWVDLCRNCPKAIAECQCFLDDYVFSSVVTRPTLDPTVMKEVQGVTTILTVREYWKALVLEADYRIIRPKRERDLDNALWCNLTRLPGPRANRGAAVVFIDTWIVRELAANHELSPYQTFVKKEATAEDIMLVLSTLWVRAKDIHCDASTRVAFYATLLLASLGFRPGVVTGLSYDQVRLGLVRDPENPGGHKMVAEITLHQNKQHFQVYKHQHNIVSFFVVPIPCRLVCLVTFIAAQALHHNAFSTPFSSFDELLQRPLLEDNDILWLSWKPEMAGGTCSSCPIISIVICGTEHGRLLVTGLHYDHMQFVSAQEGDTTPSDPAFFDLLRTASAGRDENAPLYPDAATLQPFEERPDLRQARAEHDKIRQTHQAGSKEYQRSRFKVEFLLKELSRQAVERDRKSYFELIDSLRAQGQVTTDLVPCPPPNPHRSQYWPSLCAATEIGRFFHRTDFGEDGTATFRVMLLSFLGNRFGEDKVVSAAHPPSQKLEPRPQCLLCSRTFDQRAHLTRHNTNLHIAKGTFNTPFPCPKCPEVTIATPTEWSNHVEKTHGRQFAPNLPRAERLSSVQSSSSMASRERSARCLLCRGLFYPGRSFSRHLNREHIRAGAFKESFPCGPCKDIGKHITVINLDMWRVHVVEVHGQDPQTGGMLNREVPGNGKRKAAGEVTLPFTVPPKRQRRDAPQFSVEELKDLELIDPRLL
ncbi:hypothetical protein QBC40DRAFT_249586 [Triangularia verruculosa]|uniref:C2H2-type domain-containing protein n=1 Tax=Triangularia verruculosa TaxID=2587418 RepID=A0AAN7B1F2_9PEZI|nr:hypothetical protein QBC40DRAFT_249586 [Triangularia verruculosa]